MLGDTVAGQLLFSKTVLTHLTVLTKIREYYSGMPTSPLKIHTRLIPNNSCVLLSQHVFQKLLRYFKFWALS